MPSKRLPSFNELTSNFSNALQIDSANQSYSESTISTKQHTPQPSQLNQQNHTPIQVQAPFPPAPHVCQPQNFVQTQPHPQHYPLQQQRHNPPPPKQHIINESTPSNHSEFTRFQFPPTDPNYVISQVPRQPPKQVVSMEFDHERRLSMQLPPYPSHHSKKDSYDSQTSLSTLADIASSGESNLNEAMVNVLHSVEKGLDKFRSLSQIFNDINYDFLSQAENSLNDRRNEDGEFFKLLFEYTSSTNQPMTSISRGSLNTFISNIPIPALKASIETTNEIRSVLETWLNYRDGEVKKAPQNNLRPTKASSATSTPQQPNFVRSHSRQNSRSRFVRHQHQRHQSISHIKQNEINNKEPTEPFSKKRKSTINSATSGSSNSKFSSTSSNSSTASKNDNISLIVKPPKPVTDSSVNQPPPLKGVFNEDLSIKSDHKCQQCGSDDTPEWRRGPYGSRSLCNACGLFYGKLIKKFGFDEAATIMLKRKNQGNGDDRRIPID